LGDGPYFAGPRFSLVDAAFGPVFRYFDVFETFVDLGIFATTPKVRAWRAALAARPSVAAAVAADYPERLADFLRARNSYMSRLMSDAGATAAGSPRPARSEHALT
jgi:glutathione S-transferase